MDTDDWHNQYYPKSLIQQCSPESVLFVLLIQEVTHWEMNSKQVVTPDGALEAHRCVDTGG